MQQNTFIIEAYFRSHPFAINEIWNFNISIYTYFEVKVLPSFLFVERYIVFLQK
jgi:hypothetical protein